MTLIAKEGDVVPGGSLTRLATEPYVDAHIPGPAVPDWSDSFAAAGSLDGYSYPNGLNLGGGGVGRWGVAGGHLVPQQSDGLWGLAIPLGSTPRENLAAKVQIHLPNAQFYSGLAIKAVDGNNYCGVSFDTDSNTIKWFQVLAGVYSAGGDVAPSGGLPRNADYWLMATTRGNEQHAALYSTDPEIDGSGLLAVFSRSIPAALGSGVTARPALFAAGSGVGSGWFDEFKYWSILDSPFKL